MVEDTERQTMAVKRLFCAALPARVLTDLMDYSGEVNPLLLLVDAALESQCDCSLEDGTEVSTACAKDLY